MTIVICEKPSQAANIRAAIGARFGEILPAQGHLLRFETPEELNPDWRDWGFDLLAPKNRRFSYRPNPGGGKDAALRKILDALRQTDHVVIATDCDREGEGIGREILLFAGFRGKVSRAMFSAEDPATLRAAFDALKPASDWDALYEAFYARAASDQIVNLTLTRAATLALKPRAAKGVIGIGRVKTPTLAIVCRRQDEIDTFKARAFFEIRMDIKGAEGTAALWRRGGADERIFDPERAERIKTAAARWRGPVKVDRKTKRQAPPKLMDLPTLQKRAGAWGWTAAKTLEVLQTLYETHKIATYPRAETRYLPESQKGDAAPLLNALRALPSFAAVPAFEPECRAIHFSDKGLKGAAHHAVVPNVNMSDAFARIVPSLNRDEARLFDAIARAYIAALAPDHIYDEAVVTADVVVASEDRPVTFKQTGRITLDPGWKSVFGHDDANEEDDEGDAETALTPLHDGEAVEATGAEIARKTTTPPSLYTEGGLIDAMQNAHRFIDDSAARDRLKEAKGIGTPATRGGVIEGLKDQGLIAPKGKAIIPTDAGMQLWRKLNECAPELVDPGVTAQLEQHLDAVQTGEMSADRVVEIMAERAAAHVAALRSASPLDIKIAPTAKMVDFAKEIAARKGVSLPKGCATDAQICRAFLDEHRDPPSNGVPSERQLAFARQIADAAGIEIPSAATESTAALSAWIDQNKDSAPPRMASPKQMEWIKKLIAEKGLTPPKGYPGEVGAKDASTFLEAAFGDKPKGAAGAKKTKSRKKA